MASWTGREPAAGQALQVQRVWALVPIVKRSGQRAGGTLVGAHSQSLGTASKAQCLSIQAVQQGAGKGAVLHLGLQAHQFGRASRHTEGRERLGLRQRLEPLHDLPRGCATARTRCSPRGQCHTDAQTAHALQEQALGRAERLRLRRIMHYAACRHGRQPEQEVRSGHAGSSRKECAPCEDTAGKKLSTVLAGQELEVKEVSYDRQKISGRWQDMKKPLLSPRQEVCRDGQEVTMEDGRR